MYAQALNRITLSRDFAESSAITYDAFGGDLTYRNLLVTVSCRLPQGLTDESGPDWSIGSITFTSKPGVTCHFSYRMLCDTLLPGLGTPARCGLRPFLRDDWVFIGNFVAQISRAEQEQLCAGVDAILPAYRRRLAHLWSLLGVWEFRPVMRRHGGLGLQLYLTKDWVRKDIITWVEAHPHLSAPDVTLTVTDPTHGELVINSSQDKTIRYASLHLDDGDERHPSICYLYPKEALSRLSQDRHWQRRIGPTGIWSAPYAAKWFLTHLLPAVFDASKQDYWDKYHELELLQHQFQATLPRVSPPEARTSGQLWHHWTDAAWVLGHHQGAYAPHVRPCFEALLSLAKQLKPTSWEDGEFCQLALKLGVPWPQERYYPQVLAWIERQAPMIRTQEIIPGDVINRLYEVFLTILAECPNVQSAFLLQPIITAIYPQLWELGRFARRAWETLQVR